MAEGKGSATLYRIDFTRDLNLVVKIVGEGNSEIVDDYSIVCGHGGGNNLCITHNSGPSSIRIYRDNDYNYYVYVSGWGYAVAYFANRIPMNNTISATKVDIDISTPHTGRNLGQEFLPVGDLGELLGNQKGTKSFFFME